MLQNLSLDKNDTPSSVSTHRSAVRRRAPRAPAHNGGGCRERHVSFSSSVAAMQRSPWRAVEAR
eukprot:994902-Prymnesium_polylepis.1